MRLRGTGVEDFFDTNGSPVPINSIYSFVGSIYMGGMSRSITYRVHFDGMDQSIWVRDNWDETCSYRIHGMIIIKQSHRTLTFSQLTLVPIDTVLLADWVVLNDGLMRLVVEEDVR